MTRLDANANARAPLPYGGTELNPLPLAPKDWHDYLNRVDGRHVALDDPRVARVERIRFVTDRGHPFYDLSYAFVRLTDGTVCNLDVDREFRKGRPLSVQMVEWARSKGVYAKGLGLLDAVSVLY